MTTVKSKLLIVDDEPGMRSTLRRIMKMKGFEVEVAEDGEQAIQVAATFRPDILLMDIRMPGIDGVEAWRRLKPLCPEACVIFMTAYASDKSTSEARIEGAVEVFSKPLDLDALCQMITAVGRPILVVDDDPGFRDSLERALKQHAFRVTSVANSEAALATFAERPQSVVLLDMKLEESSGLEVLKQIRDRAADVFVILMTGFSELQTEMQSGLEVGAVASLTKPFDIDELVGEIRRVSESSDADA